MTRAGQREVLRADPGAGVQPAMTAAWPTARLPALATSSTPGPPALRDAHSADSLI
jgi:hypothetical protein